MLFPGVRRVGKAKRECSICGKVQSLLMDEAESEDVAANLLSSHLPLVSMICTWRPCGWWKRWCGWLFATNDNPQDKQN